MADLDSSRGDLRSCITSLGGPTPYRHALFYRYPGGLRFELSEGGSALDQVLAALRKATAICADIFDDRGLILVHLQKCTADGNPFSLRHTLRELGSAGIEIPRRRESWVVTEEEVGEPDVVDALHWVNLAFELPVAKLQNLLWCAFTRDFTSVSPNPGCGVYLIEPSKEILVHPYDDRGMDIIGPGVDILRDLYRKHGKWLLQYDIDVMKQTFSMAICQNSPSPE